MMGDANEPFVLIHMDSYSIKTPTRENGGNDVTWEGQKTIVTLNVFSFSPISRRCQREA